MLAPTALLHSEFSILNSVTVGCKLPAVTVLLACLALVVALGLLERFAARRARSAVPIRIHVNGTRGKSTVTRLIAAGLREAGIPTMAKVTGTAPRLIRPDGSEQLVRRWAPASIREQAWLLRAARRAGARALVAECMAVQPDLQWVSEHEIVRATIGVITNVRLDHTEAMGSTGDDIAQSLANSVPRAGVLVTGDARFTSTFAARCAALGTRLVIARDEVDDLAGAERPEVRRSESRAPWLREDVAIALAVTRELGITDEVALRGMGKAAPDPGAVTSGSATIGGREVAWIDATAANDPESLDLLTPARLKPCPTVVVYNHRDDRPARLRTFAEHSTTFRNSTAVLLTGDRPSLTLAAAVRGRCRRATVCFAPSRRLAAQLGGLAADHGAHRIIFCGNTRRWANPLAGADQRPRPTTNN